MVVVEAYFFGSRMPITSAESASAAKMPAYHTECRFSSWRMTGINAIVVDGLASIEAHSIDALFIVSVPEW